MSGPSPIPMLLAAGIPAVVAGAATWILPYLWPGTERRLDSLLWLIAAAAATLGLLLLGGFTLTGSATPLVLPGGVALALLPLAALPPRARWRGADAGTPSLVLWCVAGAVLLGLLSFPWWARGLAGWSVLAASAIGAGLLAWGVEAAGRGGHRSVSLLWAGQAAAAAPFLFTLAAIGHAQVLALALAPIAGAAFAGFVGGARIFEPRGWVLPAVLVAVLVANAAMRYVPGSDDPASVVWILRLAPLALLLAPWVLVAARRLLGGRSGIIVGLLLWLAVLAGAAAAAGWAYGYESEDTTGSEGEWDYSSFGS
jgi:hypothetical protein